MSRRLGDRTWREVDGSTGAPLLAVPVGSCEQHGPHLPLDTDTRIATAVAAGLADAMPDVLVAPALAISSSGEHAAFPGTLSIGTEVLTGVLVELVRSADWAAGVVLVNGHGGNVEAVHAACRTLRDEGRRVLDWWPRIPGGDAHAGRTETSLMLAIEPAAVRFDLLEPGATEPLETMIAVMRERGVGAVSPNGVLGDPTGADATSGAALLAALVADAVARVRAWTS
jgi:mycofactocin system creatininase family protein